MIALIQRVTEARVTVDDRVVGQIERGLLALVAVERGDDDAGARRLAERIVAYRVFPDSRGRMNLDLVQAGGSLLMVSQFTLAADTTRGNRPSFTPAAEPETGRRLFEACVTRASERLGRVETGEYGADMQVALVNDGPVTFWLRVAPR